MNSERYEEWMLSGFTQEERDDAIRQYADRFGLAPTNAPSTTGLALLRVRQSKIGKLSVLRNPGGLEKIFGKHQPGAILWLREPFDGEDAIPLLYSWDKRASYLHACDVPLGVGKYELAPFGTFIWGDVFAGCAYRNTAGVYRVEFGDDAVTEGDPTRLGLRKVILSMVEKREWFYTPMVVALAQLGLRFKVTKGYWFPESSKLLTFWRDQFLDVIKPAGGGECSPALRAMVKATYTQAIGLMGSAQQKDRESELSMYRPDWRGQIIDQASARMLHNVAKIHSLYPGSPVALYDDCLYYLLRDGRPMSEIFRTDKTLSVMYRRKGVYDVSSSEARTLLRCKKPLKFARDIKKFEEVRNENL